jgi:hypothetical protein
MESDLSLTTQQIHEHFQSVLNSEAPDLEPKTADLFCALLKKVLGRFMKNFPVKSALKKGKGSLSRFFGFKRKFMEREEAERRELLKDKTYLCEKVAKVLERRLERAQAKVEELTVSRGNLENDMLLLRILLKDAEDNLTDSEESFRVLHEEQDKEIRRLRREPEDWDVNVTLKEVTLQFLVSRLPGNGTDVDSGVFVQGQDD